MKMILAFLFLLSQLYGESFEHMHSRSCLEIMKEIDLLKKEKFDNTSAKVATFFFAGAYVFGISNKEIDMKIRALRLGLFNCSDI
ncbi:hypothetical protein KJ877_02255 [bacterium]|nr:hypothetical protein [bacterium]MBU1990689.1 hypothetical protein [bacterium]